MPPATREANTEDVEDVEDVEEENERRKVSVIFGCALLSEPPPRRAGITVVVKHTLSKEPSRPWSPGCSAADADADADKGAGNDEDDEGNIVPVMAAAVTVLAAAVVQPASDATNAPPDGRAKDDDDVEKEDACTDIGTFALPTL